MLDHEGPIIQIVITKISNGDTSFYKIAYMSEKRTEATAEFFYKKYALDSISDVMDTLTCPNPQS
jgi:hypothetical protein